MLIKVSFPAKTEIASVFPHDFLTGLDADPGALHIVTKERRDVVKPEEELPGSFVRLHFHRKGGVCVFLMLDKKIVQHSLYKLMSIRQVLEKTSWSKLFCTSKPEFSRSNS